MRGAGSMRIRAALAIASLCASTMVATAQPAPNAAVGVHPEVRGALALLDRWIEAHQVYEQLPGMSVGIVLDQTLMWHKGFGYANPETRQAADTSTLYSICSISKLFTSIALMQQRDAGRLQLDDPVAKHLDWFNIEQTYPDGEAVTVRGLLSHSSGLPRESLPAYWNPDYPFPSRDALIQALARQRTLYPAGRYFQYSNLALTLAGEIAAARARKPYAELVDEAILKPLGLTNTRPYLPRAAHGKAMAIGYGARDRAGNRAPQPPFDTAGIAPAAGFTSNITDLAKFAAWQFRLLHQGGTEVLSASTLREMQRVHWVDPDWKTTWGLGFAVQKVGDDTMVSHGGACPGYSTAFTMMPKHKLAVIVLINASGTEPEKVVSNVYKVLGPALQEASENGAPTDITDLSAYEGLYHNPPWSSEVAIVQQGGRLLIAELPSDDLTRGLIKLEHQQGDVFRRIREADDDLGEHWTFRRDAAGRVAHVAVHGIVMRRVE
jgi:CubicO group peptidase (beta-lactamase class C family)